MSTRELLKFLALIVLCALAITALSTLTGCAETPTHNKHGGYIPACGELPPLVGDDC